MRSDGGTDEANTSDKVEAMAEVGKADVVEKDSGGGRGAGDAASTTRCDCEFVTTIPVLEWDEATRWNALFAADEERFARVAEGLYELEMAYRTGDFDDARNFAAELIESSDDLAVRLSALCTLFMTCIASGDPDGAYERLRVLCDWCSKGLMSNDLALWGTSYMCAMRIENVLMAQVFDIPEMRFGIDQVPGGMKAYLGYSLSLREVRNGNIQKAAGITFAFQQIMGPHYPLSSIGLGLVSATAALVDQRFDAAVEEFMRAWRLSGGGKIVMPFVETNFLLFGLPRRCADRIPPEVYRRIESMVHQFHDGWFGLRRKCGLSVFGETLTPIETYTAGLASLGWRNKEIAQHLNIAENTVKHLLTSIYQKLGISRRVDLRGISYPSVYEGNLIL